MKALFEVGEEVILCSKNQPEKNGEAVVLLMVEPNSKFNCPHCERGLVSEEVGGRGYFLDIKTNHDRLGCCAIWDESALRKKHNGGDFSFDELMKEMMSGKKIKA